MEAPIFLALAAAVLMVVLSVYAFYTALLALTEPPDNPSVNCMLLAKRGANVTAMGERHCAVVNGTILYYS